MEGNRRLTLNLGLRWDVVGAMYEDHGWGSDLGPTTPNPGAPATRELWSSWLICIKRRSKVPTYGEVGPRVGFAYALSNKLVLRGGYGINYSPPIYNGFGPATIDGYSGSKNLTRQTLNPVLYWDNGYPAYTAKLPVLDPTLDNGSSIAYISPNSSRSPTRRTSAWACSTVLNDSTTIMANYVGIRGKRLNAAI